MSQDMRNVCQSIRIEKLRKEQDRLFRRNAFIRQKIAGTAFSLVSIGAVWFLSETYGQTEYAIFLPVLMFFGIYAILTDKLICKED